MRDGLAGLEINHGEVGVIPQCDATLACNAEHALGACAGELDEALEA